MVQKHCLLAATITALFAQLLLADTIHSPTTDWMCILQEKPLYGGEPQSTGDPLNSMNKDWICLSKASNSQQNENDRFR